MLTSNRTVGSYLFRIRTNRNCTLDLETNRSCAHSITLLSLVRKKLNRFLTSTTTIATRSMLDQARKGQHIKIVHHCALILLKSFLVHPDHIDSIPRMKQADHNITIMRQAIMRRKDLSSKTISHLQINPLISRNASIGSTKTASERSSTSKALSSRRKWPLVSFQILLSHKLGASSQKVQYPDSPYWT